MASVNKVIIVGNLGRDPEIRYPPGGDAICNVSIATTDTWKDKQTGEKRENTEWHRVVFFGKLAEIAGQYLKKGRPVYVEGSLRTRSWEKEGQTHYSTEIRATEMQMLGGRGDGESGDGAPAQQRDGIASRQHSAGNSQSRPQQTHSAPASGGGFGDFDDDIPFLPLGHGRSHHCI